MSPQRMDSNFEGMAALPVTLRNQRGPRGGDYHPQTTGAEDVRECRALLGNESRPTPSWQALDWMWDELPGWTWDEVLLCWRWAAHLLGEEDREALERARTACVLEEVHG